MVGVWTLSYTNMFYNCYIFYAGYTTFLLTIENLILISFFLYNFTHMTLINNRHTNLRTSVYINMYLEKLLNQNVNE